MRLANDTYQSCSQSSSMMPATSTGDPWIRHFSSTLLHEQPQYTELPTQRFPSQWVVPTYHQLIVTKMYYSVTHSQSQV